MAIKNTIKDKLSYQVQEMDLGSKLAQEIYSLGINLNNRQRTEIINFVRCRTHSLDLQSGTLDKRQIEKDLQFRLGTLKQISKQISRDQNSYEASNDDLVTRQIFLALIETASLIQERKVKTNIRDDLALDFHLWVLNQMLKEHEVTKPAHVLALILRKVGYWKGRGAALKVPTIQNKILRANKLIQEAQKRGACHSVNLISESSRWHSEKFISTLAQGCSSCSKIWIEILGVGGVKNTPWSLAVLDLKKKIPLLTAQIQDVGDSLPGEGEIGMPLEQILDFLPRKYQGSFLHLFEAKLFV